MKRSLLMFALAVFLPLPGRGAEGAGGKPREQPAERQPILELGASDGVFYRVQIYPDLSVKGYTRHSGTMATPEDATFSGKVPPAVLAVIIGAIENTGFQRISAKQVAEEKAREYPGSGSFRTDAPHTCATSRLKDHEFDVSVYDVAGQLAEYPKVKSLEVADRGRAAIVSAAKLVMELRSVEARPTEARSGSRLD